MAKLIKPFKDNANCCPNNGNRITFDEQLACARFAAVVSHAEWWRFLVARSFSFCCSSSPEQVIATLVANTQGNMKLLVYGQSGK